MGAIDSGAWRRRMRWRLRGALTWPLFVVLTVLEAVAIHLWPIAGDRTGPVAALLLAGFVNWMAVAVGAPLLARWRRRRRAPSEPLAIATDRAATGLLCGVAVVFAVAAGLNHSNVTARGREDAAMRLAVLRVVDARFPAYLSGLTRLDVDRPADHLYRTCVTGLDPQRPLCMYVETDRTPARVRIDSDRRPNAALFGPGPADG